MIGDYMAIIGVVGTAAFSKGTVAIEYEGFMEAGVVFLIVNSRCELLDNLS